MYPVCVKNDLCPHVFTVLKDFCLGISEKYSHIKFGSTSENEIMYWIGYLGVFKSIYFFFLPNACKNDYFYSIMMH